MQVSRQTIAAALQMSDSDSTLKSSLLASRERRVSLNENVVPSASSKFGEGEGIGQLGVGYCIFTMVNAVIGVGIVALPSAFSNIGIVSQTLYR